MKKDKPQMINRLINTLRKRGAQGRSFPVQASEATQAAELIAEVVAQRDALLEAMRRGFLISAGLKRQRSPQAGSDRSMDRMAGGT